MYTDNNTLRKKCVTLYLQDYMTQKKVGELLGITNREVSLLLRDCITDPEVPLTIAEKIIQKALHNSAWKTGGNCKKLKSVYNSLLEIRKENLNSLIEDLEVTLRQLKEEREQVEFLSSSFPDYFYEEEEGISPEIFSQEFSTLQAKTEFAISRKELILQNNNISQLRG